jgi:hypothetical protein
MRISVLFVSARLACLAGPALAIVTSLFACDDVECPAGTTESDSKCIRESANSATMAPEGAPTMSSAANMGSSSVVQPTASDGVGNAGASGNAPSTSGSGANVAGTVGTPRAEDAPRIGLVNGDKCSENGQCKSGHCDRVCCEKGNECCRTELDCSVGVITLTCDDATQCLGQRLGGVECIDFRCESAANSRNDSACDETVEASSCGLYRSVFCNGETRQNGAPTCATSCANDNACDPTAKCINAKCVSGLPNGEKCRSNNDCSGRNCQNIVDGMGICCGPKGDCCKVASDCPAGYTQEPWCSHTPEDCHGEQFLAACREGLCVSSRVEMTAACEGRPVSCDNNFIDSICSNGLSRCKTSCRSDDDCNGQGSFCNSSARCQLALNTSEPCNRDRQCGYNICRNGVCAYVP